MKTIIRWINQWLDFKIHLDNPDRAFYPHGLAIMYLLLFTFICAISINQKTTFLEMSNILLSFAGITVVLAALNKWETSKKE